MDIQYQKVTLEEREQIQKYMKYNDCRSCEQTFANVFLWSREYPVEYAIVEDCLVYRSMRSSKAYSFPVGPGDRRAALSALLAECEKEKRLFQMTCVTPEQFELLETWFPGRFSIVYDRDIADYVYETEKLQTLSGKKLHGKRNHVNRFLKEYPNWSYEPITDENCEECFQMAQQWRRENHCDDDPEKNAEMCVSFNALRLLKELDLRGGLLRVDGQVIAFSIGEPVCADTFVVHIEKALAEFNGAYAMINQQFALHGADGFTYMNREDDSGEEGLRQAKLTYRPAFLVEKGFVTEAR